jgi:hypothetical protein
LFFLILKVLCKYCMFSTGQRHIFIYKNSSLSAATKVAGTVSTIQIADSGTHSPFKVINKANI